MNYGTRFSYLGLALILIAGSANLRAQEKHPIPFPAGYDYPASPETLQNMIADRDFAGIRAHGWNLWAGINQPGRDGWPIWRSWYITTQVFAAGDVKPTTENPQTSSKPGKSLKSFNRDLSSPPITFPDLPVYTIPEEIRKLHPQALKGFQNAENLPDGDVFQNNNDLMLVSEAFTTEAYDFIRKRQLYLKSHLNALLDQGKTDIPQLPPRSMVLKHMYWPVKQEGLTALPLWDFPPSINDYTGFEIKSQWKRAVAIDPARTTNPPDETAEVTFLYAVEKSDGGALGPNTYQNAKVVPIGHFYYKQISQQEYNALSTNDQVLLDLSFYWAHQRPFKANDYVVSMACHIITKEIPQWTLQTVWWHDKPDEGKYSADRPNLPQAKGPWRHYLMASEYGVPLASDPQQLPVTYNPYIELASHPIKTNCRNCHIRSTWPLRQDCYLTLPVPPNPDSTAVIQPDNGIFKGLIRGDFLWTIPDRAK